MNILKIDDLQFLLRCFVKDNHDGYVSSVNWLRFQVISNFVWIPYQIPVILVFVTLSTMQVSDDS